MTRVPRLLVASVALLCVGAPSAGAYTFSSGGARWEVPRIPYYVESAGLRVPVARAAAQWHALGLRVRFVRTTSRRAAFVVVGRRGRGCWGGVTALLGAQEGRFRYIARARVGIAPACSPRLTTYVVAHELGHVLGLGHETRRCALMNPSGDRDGISSQCGSRPLYLRSRDFLRADDGAGALALYRRPLAARRPIAYRVHIRF